MSPSHDDNEAARRERAAARGSMTAQVFDLGHEPEVNADGRTPMERIELLVDLTAAAWAMTGKPWPSLPRSQWPVRVRLLGEEA